MKPPGIDDAITATANDGQLVMSTMRVVGWPITAADPDGVRFGLMQPDENAG